MKEIMKKWKLLLVILIFVMGFSVSVNASENEIQQEEGEGEGETEISEGYRIEFVDDAEIVYTGEVLTPAVRVICSEYDDNGNLIETELEDGTYQVEYSDNINAGSTAKVIVSNIADYEGELTKEFTIDQADLSEADIALNYSIFTYTGSERQPKVTVKLGDVTYKKDTDYEVTYSNNVNIGTATVTVTGKDNCIGKKDVTYTIGLKRPVLSTSPSYNNVTLNWSKVTGATSYIIQRSTSKDAGFKTLTTITSGDTVKYVDKNVKFNKIYYYRIRSCREADNEKYYSSYSEAVGQLVKPAKSTITKITRMSATALKIEWKKVAGASGYRIYRSRTEAGDYERVGKVTGGSTLSFTDTECTCGRIYYYKVRAYRTVDATNYYGSASAAASRNTRPTRVTVGSKSTMYNSTKAVVEWNVSSYASGYEVYRATNEKGIYEKVKTLTGKSTTSWTNTGLTKGKTYYYKVRAYRKIDGKTVYSAYSNAYKKSKAGWQYVNGYKFYYNASGKRLNDVEDIIGKQSSYVIKVNKQKNCVTIYARDGDNGYIIPVKAFICSTGYATPIGTFYTPVKYRWRTLNGPCWGQWSTRIYSGFLFHSVFYRSKYDNNSLSVSAYNKLGTTASHGCVRLTARDAKWIYDNCKLKTKVIIYNGSSAGPLGKPSAYKLPYWHTWDPTDPNMQWKCEENNCH